MKIARITVTGSEDIDIITTRMNARVVERQLLEAKKAKIEGYAEGMSEAGISVSKDKMNATLEQIEERLKAIPTEEIEMPDSWTLSMELADHMVLEDSVNAFLMDHEMN